VKYRVETIAGNHDLIKYNPLRFVESDGKTLGNIRHIFYLFVPKALGNCIGNYGKKFPQLEI